MAAIAGLSIMAGQARAQEVGKPNILYIVADDLGFADVGFKGRTSVPPTSTRLPRAGRI